MLDFYAPIQVKLLSLNSLFKAESYFPTLLFYEFIAIYGDKKIRGSAVVARVAVASARSSILRVVAAPRTPPPQTPESRSTVAQ
jgi:hypothetical protein